MYCNCIAIAFKLHFNCNAIYCIVLLPLFVSQGHDSIFSQFSRICTIILMGHFIPLSCLTCFCFAYYNLILLSLHYRRVYLHFLYHVQLGVVFRSYAKLAKGSPFVFLLILLLFQLQNQSIFCSGDLLSNYLL